ncbi:MAG: hypothetical protein LBT71_02870 [Azoarcus sp.]|jgi:hypothetical protein|nr:hypothetical protein [Azoarcus sp.]
MRFFSVMMFVLCTLGGLYLLTAAPAFTLPDRGDPAHWRQFGTLAARTLGGGLLAISALAAIFLRHHYYAEVRHPPGPAVQKLYFALIVLALGLISLALDLAEPVPAPPTRSAAPAP